MSKQPTTPCLSVLLVTYNHQQHIQQALDSLLGQTIAEQIELVVADDCSTDATRSSIEAIEGKDPRFLIKFLENDSNLGITKNYQRGFAACTGKYIAVLEGDDYWISPAKLQRQLDFLEEHWECDLCATNYFIYEEREARFTPRVPAGTGHRHIDARHLIADNLIGNFSTCMYRRSALEALPPRLFQMKSYDWIVNICVARHALIGFLEEPMSVYRLHAGGVWSQTPRVEKLQQQLELLAAYDALTEETFHPEFNHFSTRLKHEITAAQLAHIGETLARPAAKALPNLHEYIPPFIVLTARFLLPPILKRFLAKHLFRTQSS